MKCLHARADGTGLLTSGRGPVTSMPWFVLCRQQTLQRTGQQIRQTAQVKLRSVAREAKKESDTISILREALDVGRRSEVDQAYQDGGVYLRSLGFDSNAEISRILDVAMNKNSLFLDQKRHINAFARKLDVEADMKPVVECLKSYGLDQKQITKIISEHPPVLCYSPEERLKPFFDYLASIRIGVDRVVKRPSLLGLEVNANLRRIVEYLREVEGKTDAELAELLETI